MLANLFLHWAFDAWMAREFPDCPFERYADDGLIRCKSGENAVAELLKEQTKMVKVQTEVARREVKSEARSNPDNPGWGRTIGEEIAKAREDRASQE